MPTRSANILFLSIAEFALVVAGIMGVLTVRQKSTQTASARVEAQRNSPLTPQHTVLEPSGYGPLAVPAEKVVRQELLGIQGDLGRVVFVIDKSGSMARGRKWDYIRGIVDTWLRYLPIERCALVMFDDTVERFPSDGRYLDLTGPDGVRNRHALLSRLASIQPNGNTNTVGAIQQAYALNPSAIVLATDGFPDRGRNRFDVQMANRAIELCYLHGRAIPVHVLALGDYFQPQLGRFLRNIADATGGAFIAR